jgi:two-component system NtrC family response regulator
VLLSLERENGNVSKAANILGVTRPTLYDLMKKHNLIIAEQKNTP